MDEQRHPQSARSANITSQQPPHTTSSETGKQQLPTKVDAKFAEAIRWLMCNQVYIILLHTCIYSNGKNAYDALVVAGQLLIRCNRKRKDYAVGVFFWVPYANVCTYTAPDDGCNEPETSCSAVHTVHNMNGKYTRVMEIFWYYPT